MESVIEVERPEVEERRTVGIIVVKDGKVVGVEVFDHPDTFEALKEEIFQKYALDIASRSSSPQEVDLRVLARLEEEIRDAEIKREETFNIGGENLYFETEEVRGHLFKRRGKPIYLSLVRK